MNALTMILFAVAGALLAWLFGEPTFVAMAKTMAYGNPFEFMNTKPKVKQPAAAAPQTTEVPQPTQKNEADEMAAAKADEEERAKRRRGAQSTVLTSSLSWEDENTDETQSKRPVRRTALGAGA